MIDTHCHLLLNDYDNIEEVIHHMDSHIMIVSGADARANEEVISLCHKYNNIYGMVGIHPEEITDHIEEDLKKVEEYLLDEKIVAVGEIGLDYHISTEKKDLQQEVFKRQILLAQKYHKPFVIHSREAMQDTYDIISSLQYPNMKAVMHCFSGSVEMAERFIKLGILLGIGGVVTFKNGMKLKEVVTKVSLSYLLLETDSPYLTPEPYRGTRNEPYNVYYVAQEIAKLKGLSLDEVIRETTLNAIRQFDLPIKI